VFGVWCLVFGVWCLVFGGRDIGEVISKNAGIPQMFNIQPGLSGSTFTVPG
jgi:hypothetical protein